MVHVKENKCLRGIVAEVTTVRKHCAEIFESNERQCREQREYAVLFFGVLERKKRGRPRVTDRNREEKKTHKRLLLRRLLVTDNLLSA